MPHSANKRFVQSRNPQQNLIAVGLAVWDSPIQKLGHQEPPPQKLLFSESPPMRGRRSPQTKAAMLVDTKSRHPGLANSHGDVHAQVARIVNRGIGIEMMKPGLLVLVRCWLHNM